MGARGRVAPRACGPYAWRMDPPRIHGPAPAGPTRRKRIREHASTVAHVLSDTPDTVTPVLATAEHPEYAAGHFLTIAPHQVEDLEDLVAYFEDVKGKREPP